MLDVSKITNAFAETAQKYCPCEYTACVNAYPNQAKPTLMHKMVIAFSVCDFETAPEGIAESRYSGEIKVSAVFYVPYHFKSAEGITAQKITEDVCKGICSEFHITGLRVSAPKPDADTECMVRRLIFTIDDELE